ncbi:MAG TPA: Fur family transcriptional regulator [Patescibacteria group bacterium]|nr:Fur family transcriptional regulator [Patescibacteria group bacterium]
MTDGPAGRLRAAGLRVTRQRIAVLEALLGLGGHRTAEEVAASLEVADLRVPRASLYHALGSLAAAGVIVVADAGPGVARYEVASSWHHHLVCRSCGAVIDVPCLRGAPPCVEADLPGATIDEAQVIFRGTCASCATSRDEGRPAG